MTLQTREQHIKRDKATSNICTAQALLSIMAGMYAVYHGPEGLKKIAQPNSYTYCSFGKCFVGTWLSTIQQTLFRYAVARPQQARKHIGFGVRRVAESAQINFRYFDNQPDLIGISLDETTSIADVQQIIQIFAEAINEPTPQVVLHNGQSTTNRLPDDLQRTDELMSHPVFSSYHSETQMVRYIEKLEGRDLSLTRSMIPLGSCTMKPNAATELMPVSLPQFSKLHPFVPIDQAAEVTPNIYRDSNKPYAKLPVLPPVRYNPIRVRKVNMQG